MAQQLPCDICAQEYAVQLLTNTDSGEVMALGPACLPVFYGQSLTQLLGDHTHTGTAARCAACKAAHQLMTKGFVTLAEDTDRQVPEEIPGQSAFEDVPVQS